MVQYVVRRLLVEQGCAIARELYLGMVVDRATGRVTVMASTEGGVEIEEVAARTPEKILRETLDPAIGLAGYQARRLAFGLGLGGKEQLAKATGFLTALGRAFVELDASMIEINPLVVTEAGDVIALDAKIGFDDNALFRHPDVRELRDPNEEDPREREAAKFDLSYIALDGNIGCMVNGAGLAMATMDSVKVAGGTPANFLDVGGGADTEKVKAAFKIILSDAAVKAMGGELWGMDHAGVVPVPYSYTFVSVTFPCTSTFCSVLVCFCVARSISVVFTIDATYGLPASFNAHV